MNTRLDAIRHAADSIRCIEELSGLPAEASPLADEFFRHGEYETFGVTYPNSSCRPLYDFLAPRLGMDKLPPADNGFRAQAASDPDIAFLLRNRELPWLDQLDELDRYRGALNEQGQQRLDSLRERMEAHEQARYDAEVKVHERFGELPKERQHELLAEYWGTLSTEERERYLAEYNRHLRERVGSWATIYDVDSERLTPSARFSNLTFRVADGEITVLDGTGYAASVRVRDVLARSAVGLQEPPQVALTVPDSYHDDALFPVIAWLDTADGKRRLLTEAEMRDLYPAEARPDRGRLDSWLGRVILATHAVHAKPATMNMPAAMSLGNGQRHKDGSPLTQQIGVAQVEVAIEYLLSIPTVAARVLADETFFGRLGRLIAPTSLNQSAPGENYHAALGAQPRAAAHASLRDYSELNQA